MAVKHILLAPDKTANKYLMISNFAATQREVVASLEKLSGHSYATENVSLKEKIEKAQQTLAKGDRTGRYNIIRGAFFGGRYGAHFEVEGELANELVGLPKVGLDEVVREVLEKYN